jgi:hypothetical protein
MADKSFVDVTVAQIARWQGVAPPNDTALRMLAELQTIIADFEAQRGVLAFEDEPSTFELALLAAADVKVAS